ncbi:HAD family hydrolase [Clostridium tertium]|uniref:HAD family hydrolase n=1 Tax=Clostridium TaxID=1485 RepID=UPI00115A9A3E|nr:MULTISPECIES: HAD family hydrolase [Clostridium]MBS4958680.1 HAD family hydrolase [Clostridium sp.]MDB1921638.1 HAD family hydrolase [Clostridium tertium]MDB1924842.1 HAD family hydrolase [Clostridium tertium]MDB1930551.1 HAD family hydrolase [Clostridium tertium]MDU2157400.1 HAD family hydrolase [Clostridium sp.]
MESYRTLVAFDLDGTLNRTELYAINAYKKTFKELNIGPFSDSEIKSRFGAPFQEDIEYFLGDDNRKLENLYRELLLKNWNKYLKLNAKTYDGVVDVLESLRKKGYILAICSNATIDEINNTLDILKIKDKFDYIQGLTIKNNKEDSLRVLINKAKVDLVYMVGDRFYDYKAAQKNNAKFIGCLYGYGKEELYKAEYLINNIRELDNILK